MVLRSDKEKIRELLSETIRLLCKNGLQFKTEFSVEALVGITLDESEEFFLSIKETVKSDLVSSSEDSALVLRDAKPETILAQCQRKRVAESVTSRTDETGAGNLGTFSLKDMQESAHMFWRSVTEGGNAPGGNIAKKKRLTEQVGQMALGVKDEQVSESSTEEVESTSSTHQHGQQLSQPLPVAAQITQHVNMYGPSVTSAPGMPVHIPPAGLPQVWDHLPPFSTLPSGIPSTTATVTTDNSHPGIASRPDASASLVDLDHPIPSASTSGPAPPINKGLSPKEQKQQRLEHLQKDPFYIPRLMKRILLTKGREVTPKQVSWNYSYRDRPGMPLIHQVMKELHNKGLGVYGKSDRKTTFSKKEPWTVGTLLVAYGINIEKYEKQYYAGDVEDRETYTH